MATAKFPLSLYSESPEGQEAIEEYKQSQQRLIEALEGRKNQLFDPTMLAMAQGFLSPTKTGSFGEALGNVAARVAPVQQEEEQRAREIAKMRFELAQQNLAQQRATEGEKVFRGLLGGMGGAEAPTAAPGAAPAAGAPQGAAPQAGRQITPQDIAKLATIDLGKAKILQDMVKMDQERFAISMNGIVFDKAKGQYLNLEIPGQKQEPFSTPYGRFEMTPNEYSQFRQAEAAGKGKEWIDSFRRPGGMAAPATAPGAPAGRLTVEEQAARAKGAETKATETAKAEVTRTQDMINAAQDATGKIASYASLRSIASRPDATQIFGIFNRPDVGTAILNLVNEGVRGQGGSIQVGALEDTLRNVGLPQDQIDRYRFALATMANIQLQQAKLAAGQGAVSNFERDLFANATISPKDNPGTILAKLSMLEARADFDRKRASALRRSKMEADEYMETDDYNKLVQDYLGKISNISSSIGSKPTAGRPQMKYLGVEKKGQ